MLKNNKGILIQMSNKQDFIYIRQGEIYFIYCVKENNPGGE